MSLRRNFMTHSGVNFDVMNFTPDQFRIDDIAHGLSMECRYGGQCKEFYSVAEHSVILSHFAYSTHDARILLLHDATEAYLKDIPRSLKLLPMFEEYRRIEDKLYKAIMYEFGLPTEFPRELKYYDDCIVSNEKPVLFDHLPDNWNEVIEAFPPLPAIHFAFWNPKTAKEAFLERYRELF